MTWQIVFAEPMRDNDDTTRFRVVQPRLNLVIEQIIHALQTLAVVAILNLDGIVEG